MQQTSIPITNASSNLPLIIQQLQTVQVGNQVVGHAHVGDQVVGKTADVNGYAFSSEVRHDRPVYAPAAPIATIAAAPILAPPAPVYAPAPIVAAPAPLLAPAPGE